MSKSILDRMKAALIAMEQTTLFGSTNTEKDLTDACVEYLKSRGYSVVVPKIFSKTIGSTGELVDYFYELFNKTRAGHYTTSYNTKKDMAIAKRFIESRIQATGVNKKIALNECGEIIKTVFDNEKEFNFTTEIGFYMFGQANMKWVTDKAIEMMNKKIGVEKEKKAEKMREEMIAAQDTSDLAIGDLDEILLRLEDEDA